jgi:hypothetical protein
MPDYKNGKIYKLVDNTNGNIYIGSTTQSLNRRKTKHILDSKKYGEIHNNKLIKYSSHSIIKNNNFSMILLENYPCNNKTELRIKEQEYIDKLDCVNSQRAYRTKEQKAYSDKKCWAARNGTKKMKDYKHNLYKYQITWGGNKLTNNNLLSIDLSLFD